MASRQLTKIIAVTGTKGKTSTVRAIHYSLQAVRGRDMLRVDTNEVMFGSVKLHGIRSSMQRYGFVPTLAPGRFLSYAGEPLEEEWAVLEASIGCARVGLGYASHVIGIFTNIYDDHVGTVDYLQDRNDLADAKASFIFGAIRAGGAAIYNADDPLVFQRLSGIPTAKQVTKIGFALDSHAQGLEFADVKIFPDDQDVVIRIDNENEHRLSLTEMRWALEGKHIPTLQNALAIVGALWFVSQYDSSYDFIELLNSLKHYQYRDDGGRLVRLKASNGANILLDFAHERESLQHIAKYARAISGKSGRVIGIIRLDSARPANHIIDTTRSVAPLFDQLVIYDKDVTKGVEPASKGVAELMYRTARETSVSSVRLIPKEEDALLYAQAEAAPDDTVVHIISNPEISLELVRKVFDLPRS